jgi:hypothetical protein
MLGSKMTTFDPASTADLAKASEHVAYECKMLRRTFEMLRDLVADKTRMDATPGLRQALMESFIVHARSLKLFFYPNPKARSHYLDIRADHFIVDWSARRPACGITDDQIDRMHREIAHISAARFDLKPGEPQWDCGKLLDALNPAIDLFFETVGSAKLSEDVRKSIERQPAGVLPKVRFHYESLATANVIVHPARICPLHPWPPASQPAHPAAHRRALARSGTSRHIP